MSMRELFHDSRQPARAMHGVIGNDEKHAFVAAKINGPGKRREILTLTGCPPRTIGCCIVAARCAHVSGVNDFAIGGD